MLNNKPNIFEFATKELSQDAVFCYILDCFNCVEKRKIATKFLKLINFKYIDEIEKLEIKRQEDHSDVKAIVTLKDEAKKHIIIEDKVYSSLHDNQLKRYKDDTIERHSCTENDITGVFFKIGKPLDWEENTCIHAGFIILDYNEFAKYLKEIADNDYILKTFSEFFQNRISLCHEIDTIDFDTIDETLFDKTLQERYGQRKFAEWLLYQVFENTDYKYNKKKQYDVNNYGRPCTQYTFLFNESKYKNKHNDWNLTEDEFPTSTYNCFFRIDRNSKGWYIAVRQYFHDGATEEETDMHDKMHDDILELLKIDKDHAPNTKAEKEKTLLLFNIHSIDDVKKLIPVFTKTVNYLFEINK